MKSTFSNWTTILLIGVGTVASVVGFMIKLPSGLRHIDKELHALFYFLAAAFLNILLAKRNLVRHLVIFGILYIFGIGIEYAQSYSNRFFHKRIHGRYDPEDVAANLNGLLAFSLLWVAYVSVYLVYSKMNIKEAVNK